MATDPTPAKTPNKPVSPQREAFDKLLGLATKHVNEQLGALAARLASALIDPADMPADAHTVTLRIKAGNLLKAHSYAFVHLASTGVEQALRKEIDALAPAAPQRRRSTDQALTLVPYEEMDNRVAFSSISRPFEVDHADALATLNVRLAFLLDREILRIGQNPFRPEVLLEAIQGAWCEFNPDSEAHGLILALLRPKIFVDLGPMYEAMTLALVRKGVLPGSVDARRIRKTDSRGLPSHAARAAEQALLAQRLRQFLSAAPERPDPFDPMLPMVPDIPGLASSGSGATWQGGQAFAGRGSKQILQQGGHISARRPLLNYLKHLQQGEAASAVGFAGAEGVAAAARAGNVFYLPRIKETAPKGSLSRGDENTIDLLSKIFDTVFLDPAMPAEIRELIQFLQIPVLKAALVDKDFFFQEAHPARRMIDLLSRMGWEQRKGPDDPLFQAMRRSVDRVGREFDQEVGVFGAAVAELEASIAAEEEAAATEMSAPIAAALKQEKVAAAGKSARTAVALRVESGEVVAVVEAFLENKWTAVLTIAYSVEEEKPGAVENATRTMDELIWSVKPKLGQAERKQLIAKLPALLATLNKWLDVIKWQDADRLQFFADLAEIHASIVRAPVDLPPERQVQIAVEMARQAAERRLEKQKAQAEAAPAPETDEADDGVDALQRGMWVEFLQPDDSVRKVKLAWISPLRTLFIFSTSTRQEAFSMSAEKLSAAFRDEQAQLIRLDGVVGLALSQAMAQAAVNDPNIDARTVCA